MKTQQHNMKPPDYKKFLNPEKRKYIPINKEEGEYIYHFLRAHPSVGKTLEIGLGYGVSAIYIASATHKIHTIIEPSRQSTYTDVAISNLKRLSLVNNCRYYWQPSHTALPLLLQKKETFDFAFIDGDHKYDSVFIDFYYIDLLLNIGGYVIFHDIQMYSIQTVLKWIQTNKKNYIVEKNPSPFLAVVRKTGTDTRHWSHFSEFYSIKTVIQIFFRNIFSIISGT